MGKTLDALKRKPGRAAEEPLPARPPAAIEPAEPDESDDVPFIEVGGRRQIIEGSREVLAVPLPARKEEGRKADEVKTAPAAVSLPVPPIQTLCAPPSAEAPGPWTVQFRPMSKETRLSASPRRVASELIAFHQPEHPVATQYRTLLAGLIGQLPTGWGQVLLFTAPAPWAGTTTVLLNLALTAARQEGRRVAVVDANLRRPALAERLGLGPAPGLREVLAGFVALPQALQDTAQTGLRALPAGKTLTGEDVRLPLDWLLPTLRQLRQQFDLVFVDAPSWNEGSEVSALAATCDAVYMVRHQLTGAPADDGNPLPLLRQPPSNLHGCILTMR